MKNKVIVITGASSGTGLCLAKEYLQLGAIVYGCARRMDEMEEIAHQGGHRICLDITDEQSIQNAIDTIIANEGHIDMLINNAGYGIYGSVENTPMEEIRRQFEVNYFGLIRITQFVLPYMRAQHSGTIVNISSMGGTFSIPFGSFYHGSKFAVEAFSDSLRMETKKCGIKTIIIEPGLIQTDWGIIAANNIRRFSANNPYEDNLNRYADYLDGQYKNTNKLTPPAVLAHKIVKITQKRCPKTRYRLGKSAKMFVCTRKMLCDAWFDKLCIASMGLKL